MADVDIHEAKKGIISWILCSGGCNRKYLQKKEKTTKRQVQRKPSWCFDTVWSCMRCLMKRTNRHQENEATPEPIEDGYNGTEDGYNGTDYKKKTPENNCTDAVSPRTEKAEEQVTVIQADLSKDVEANTKTLTDQGNAHTAASDNSFQNAPEMAEVGSNNGGDRKPSLEIDATRSTLKSCSDVSSPNLNKLVDMIVRFNGSRLNDQRADLPKLPAVNTKKVTFQSSRESLVSPSVVKPRNEYKHIQLDHLEYVGTLGKGGFGHVELVTLTTDQSQIFALKSMAKQRIVDIQWQKYVFREKDIMMELDDCPFMTRMYHTFKDKKYVYLLLEACLGGDLRRLLKKRKYFSDDQARFYMGCVLLALQYMHFKGIAHRDLKPSNMFLDSRGYLKLGDFGFSKEIGVGSKTRSNVGTAQYKAPEVFLNGMYSTAVDFWSFGVTVYEILSGRRPFDGADIRHKINQGISAIQFSPNIGNHAEDLVRNLLRPNADERLGRHGASEVQNHKWFETFNWDSLATQTMDPPFDPQVTGPTDTHNFKKHPRRSCVPPDETSGWDENF